METTGIKVSGKRKGNGEGGEVGGGGRNAIPFQFHGALIFVLARFLYFGNILEMPSSR